MVAIVEIENKQFWGCPELFCWLGSDVFFVSIFCVSLVSTTPISYVKGLIAMVYIHSMGENTMQKIYELGSELKNKVEEISKESLPKKTG